MQTKPDFYDWIGYVLAVALLLPLAWWLKANYADSIGAAIIGFFS